ncbi:hypothetical protein V9K67_10110 [Paraflavisolibacter sp. H34]|uniref:hypothetical protein n=1 Tax=Huijunlia imazamoxiresistens TaxID=3127457 RepID=UPI003019AB81
MNRKRWTPQTEVTETLLKFREKRKWQIALRRYVLEKNKSSFYAPYFGLDIASFREWIEQQFDEECSWENFSDAWQFDHVVPIAHFDFEDEADLRLCWNFTNIRVALVNAEGKRNRITPLAAKAYFEDLYRKTGYEVCRRMMEKIEQIEEEQVGGNERLEDFIRRQKSHIDLLVTFTSYDFDRLNTGTDIADITFEKEFIKKFS